MSLFLDGVFANSQSVPQFDGSVAGGGNDLTVVSRESDGKDILGVSNKSSGGVSGGKVPEAESSVPRSGESELSIGGDDNVADEVGVSLKTALGDTVLSVFTGQVPHDDGLVTGSGEEHVWEDWGGCDLGNPPVVPLEGSF